MTVLEFMGAHPILTFFLASIAGNTIIKSVYAIVGIKKKKHYIGVK